MSPLFKNVQFNLAGLMESVDLGRLALPDLQRPFVWPNKKVRDLFDSMYRGYPVGYLLLWENGGTEGVRTIGNQDKQLPPTDLVIDGQQRLTSLYAVFKEREVLRENFHPEMIEIAFRPTRESFEVADAAIRKDPEWIPNISVFWRDGTDLFGLVRDYLERIGAERVLSTEERKRIEQGMLRVSQLRDFPFTALSLSSSLSEEQVADVFVRINSQGTPLNQADFILTLMSVFQDEQRKALEDFCRRAKIPSRREASPYNHFIDPDPDQLLRVSVALGFRRARLQHVYSILRGKDLETGEYSEERRQSQFERLSQAQTSVLDLIHWHEFLKCLLRSGHLSAKTVSSNNALLYTYALFLLGKLDYQVEPRTLRTLIARWFFFVSLTGRYTTSPESRMEQDLADLRGVKTADDFREYVERTIRSHLTNDYWTVTLPAELATSAARSPALFAYYAALNLLDAQVLFSKLKVRELLDPVLRARRTPIERHHLFPKAYLARLGISSNRETNQIANFALVEWGDNLRISDRPPVEYLPESSVRLTPQELARQCHWHALPEAWTTMAYPAFLSARRKLLATVIREGFETLDTDRGQDIDAGREPVHPLMAVLEFLPAGSESTFQSLVSEPLRPIDDLKQEVVKYLESLEERSSLEVQLDLDTARRCGERCLALLAQAGGGSSDDASHLVQAAATYFVEEDDAISDRVAGGFSDDEEVIEAVERILAAIGLENGTDPAS